MHNTDNHDGSSRGGSAATYSGLTRSSGRFELWPYLVSLIAVAGATVVAWLLQPIVGLEDVDPIFLTAIIAIAVRYGLRPSLIGSVASLLAYNFFFIPPLHTFAVAEPTNLAAGQRRSARAQVTANLSGMHAVQRFGDRDHRPDRIDLAPFSWSDRERHVSHALPNSYSGKQ